MHSSRIVPWSFCRSIFIEIWFRVGESWFGGLMENEILKKILKIFLKKYLTFSHTYFFLYVVAHVPMTIFRIFFWNSTPWTPSLFSVLLKINLDNEPNFVYRVGCSIWTGQDPNITFYQKLGFFSEKVELIISNETIIQLHEKQ